MVFKSHNTLLVIGLCLLAGTFAQTINFPAFEQYVTAYNKTYNSVEAASRKTIYDARVAILKTITVYTPAVNNFTDWSDDELKKIKGLLTQTSPSGNTAPSPTTNPPSSLNWATHKKVSAVKNQGNCGSCWAFAATSYAESKLMVDGRYDTIDLSDQKILKCTSQSDCNGGYLEYAMNSVVDGIPSGAIYSYDPNASSVGICSFVGFNIGKSAQNYYNLNDSQLITLLQERPIAVSVSATGWQRYGSGVFQCSPTDTVNHAALLVGYDSNNWLLKNSWGTNWGESGFIRVSRTAGLNCKIGTSAHRTFQWHLISALMMVLIMWAFLF